MACRDRGKRSTKPTYDERSVIRRITKRLEDQTLPVLFCIDNGTGINPDRMSSLLTPGNSDKGPEGAGSFGVGHLTAFAASDLRYVLYGSRYRTTDGRLKTVSAGHVILATHHPANGKRALLSADGFWIRTGQRPLPFLGDPSEYPETAPQILGNQLDTLSDTGTVVCVVGFNDFRGGRTDKTPAEAIARVAAQNFTDAIHRGTLRVSIQSDSQDDIVVDSQSLGTLLRPWRNRNMHRSPRGGHIGGADAFRAYKTLTEGHAVAVPDLGGTEVRFRHLSDDELPPQTNVHLFRKGMWITSRPRRLERSKFVDCKHFDAVVCLETGRFEELVRNAEGPEHLGLQPKRLSTADRSELYKLSDKLAAALREAAGEQPDDEVVEPKDFALLGGDAASRIERVRRPRTPSMGSRSVAGRKRRKRKGRKRTKRKQPTTRVRRPDYASSLVAIPATAELLVDLAYREDLTVARRVAVRITRSNGSDASCDRPLSHQFLPIRQVVSAGRTYQPTDGENLGIVVPMTDSRMRLRIYLVEPAPDPQLLTLDLVARRRR